MDYYRIIPEAPGQLGHNTVMNTLVHPPVVEHLHFVFDGWLGDDLVECFPCFLVTDHLADKLIQAAFSGFAVKDAALDCSQQFVDLYGTDKKLPGFKWLQVNGNMGDDVFIDSEQYLVASASFYQFIKKYAILNHCEVEPRDT